MVCHFQWPKVYKPLSKRDDPPINKDVAQVKAVHKDLGDEAHGFADLWSFCGAPDTERWTWEPWRGSAGKEVKDSNGDDHEKPRIINRGKMNNKIIPNNNISTIFVVIIVNSSDIYIYIS